MARPCCLPGPEWQLRLAAFLIPLLSVRPTMLFFLIAINRESARPIPLAELLQPAQRNLHVIHSKALCAVTDVCSLMRGDCPDPGFSQTPGTEAGRGRPGPHQGALCRLVPAFTEATKGFAAVFAPKPPRVSEQRPGMKEVGVDRAFVISQSRLQPPAALSALGGKTKGRKTWKEPPSPGGTFALQM